jgi:nucleoside-diphosphate-sugar epimerase
MSKNEKVLVTGAGGFIGSHLVETLLEKECNVRAFVKYNGRGDCGMLSDLPIESQKSIELVAGDIRDLFLSERPFTIATTCLTWLHLQAFPIAMWRRPIMLRSTFKER